MGWVYAYPFVKGLCFVMFLRGGIMSDIRGIFYSMYSGVVLCWVMIFPVRCFIFSFVSRLTRALFSEPDHIARFLTYLGDERSCVLVCMWSGYGFVSVGV